MKKTKTSALFAMAAAAALALTGCSGSGSGKDGTAEANGTAVQEQAENTQQQKDSVVTGKRRYNISKTIVGISKCKCINPITV